MMACSTASSPTVRGLNSDVMTLPGVVRSARNVTIETRKMTPTA